MSSITPREERRELTVLFVGTPPVDLQRVCDESGAHAIDIEVAADGREAISRLTDADESADGEAPPDLVIIRFGFRLPDGITVLHAIKSSPRLGAVPVVVLGRDGSDAETTYEHGGNAHVTMPETVDGRAEILGAIERFWFDWVRYPAECLTAEQS